MQDGEEFKENEDLDEAMSDNISDIDSTEFVTALEKQLSSLEKNEVTQQDAVNLLLVVYSESSMEEIQKLEQKLK